MELEELKTTWKSVEPHIQNLSHAPLTASDYKEKTDLKSKLLHRMIFAASFTFVCLIMMGSSPWWAPVKLPVAWLIVYCTIIFAGFLCELYIARLIHKIELWRDSPAEILDSIINIKKSYRRFELWGVVLVIISMLWLSLIPPFANTFNAIFIWVLLAIGYAIEYLWYRKMMKHLNELSNWKN